MGPDRATAAEGREAFPVSGPEAVARSAGAAGDLVCAAHGDRVAASAARARLRRRLDLLPADGGVAAGGSVGATARVLALGAAGCRWDRMVACCRGLQPRASEKG